MKESILLAVCISVRVNELRPDSLWPHKMIKVKAQWVDFHLGWQQETPGYRVTDGRRTLVFGFKLLLAEALCSKKQLLTFSLGWKTAYSKAYRLT